MDQQEQEISELFSLWFLKLIIWPYMLESSFCFSTRLKKKKTLDTLFCISDWYPTLILVSIGFGLRALFFLYNFLFPGFQKAHTCQSYQLSGSRHQPPLMKKLPSCFLVWLQVCARFARLFYVPLEDGMFPWEETVSIWVGTFLSEYCQDIVSLYL